MMLHILFSPQHITEIFTLLNIKQNSMWGKKTLCWNRRLQRRWCLSVMVPHSSMSYCVFNPEHASLPNWIIIAPFTLDEKELVKWISPVSCITLNVEAADLAQKPTQVHVFGEITSVFRNLTFYGDKRQRLKNFQGIFRSSSELFVMEITLIFQF